MLVRVRYLLFCCPEEEEQYVKTEPVSVFYIWVAGLWAYVA
jgi:hypothetical protein